MTTKLIITDIEYDITKEDITITDGMDDEAIEDAVDALRNSLPKTIEIEVDEADEKNAILPAAIVTKQTGFVVSDYDTIVYENGFDKNDFLWYVNRNYNKPTSAFAADLVENLVNCAINNVYESKDQLCYFIADILPEIEFAEVAQFADDDILTEWGKQQKADGLRKYGGRKFWKYGE